LQLEKAKKDRGRAKKSAIFFLSDPGFSAETG
jgi:hypothetical protein